VSLPAFAMRFTRPCGLRPSYSGPWPASDSMTFMTSRPYCDLAHDRARVAVVNVEVKSTRVGRPGHPMTRKLALCATHARELRALGFELVGISKGSEREA
jgi:hypothetical protein